MNMRRACPCIITFSLVSVAVPAMGAGASSGTDRHPSASSGSRETRTPATTDATNRQGTLSGAPRAGKPKEAPGQANPAQQVEERVRSGQMEQPIAQGAISDRLNQLESGSK